MLVAGRLHILCQEHIVERIYMEVMATLDIILMQGRLLVVCQLTTLSAYLLPHISYNIGRVTLTMSI